MTIINIKEGASQLVVVNTSIPNQSEKRWNTINWVFYYEQFDNISQEYDGKRGVTDKKAWGSCNPSRSTFTTKEKLTK
jgi:hypothetical protein